MKAWENLSEDQKLKAIYDKHERFEEGFGIIERKFDAIEGRLDAMDKRLAAMDERFERLERLIEKTHRDHRYLSGYIMFSKQTIFFIFSNILPDEAKETIRRQAEAGLKDLEGASLDEAMLDGIKSSKQVMDHYLQAV